MTETHRAATIFAGFFTLIQSAIWVTLAIFFLSAYTCTWEIPLKEPPDANSILYITYFKGPCYGEPSPNAERTYIWMVIYGVISAIWIPTSALLAVGAILKVEGKYGACMYIPWLVVTILILIIDLVATVIYVFDILHTLTVSDYKQFMEPLKVNLHGADGITVLPAIEMTLYFCRVVIVWIINLILIVVVIQATHAVTKLGRVGNYAQNIQRDRSELNGSELRDPDHQRECGGKRWVNVIQGDSTLPSGFGERGDTGGMGEHPWALTDMQSQRRDQEPETPVVKRVEPWVVEAAQRDRDRDRDRDNASSASRSSDPPVQRPNTYYVDGTPAPQPQTPVFPHRFPPRGDGSQMPWTYLGGPKKEGPRPSKEKPRVPAPDYTMHQPKPRSYPPLVPRPWEPAPSRSTAHQRQTMNSGGY